MRGRTVSLLAAAVLAAAWTQAAVGQQRPQARQPQTQPRGVYDIYVPSQRLAGRRQQCTRDEQVHGAYCVKSCQTGYQMESSGKQLRCRALKPLPAGSPTPPLRVQKSEPPGARPAPARSQAPGA